MAGAEHLGGAGIKLEDYTKDELIYPLNRRCWSYISSTRETILKTAAKIVCGDREKQYGTPERNFDKISRLWNAYLGDNVTDAHDVAMMMCLLKVARIRTGQAREDNYIDLAGYVSIAGEIRKGNK